jgi:hypothetical protein
MTPSDREVRVRRTKCSGLQARDDQKAGADGDHVFSQRHGEVGQKSARDERVADVVAGKGSDECADNRNGSGDDPALTRAGGKARSA